MGFEKDDRVVIIHADDIASSHAANAAAFECLESGIASCGSVIVPAAWLMEAAHKCRQNKNFDIGVHLTLTSEYGTCRWRPVSSVDKNTGLLDDEGYLWKTTAQAVMNADPKAAESEMRAQVELALQNGIDVTHLDTHMVTVLHPKFIHSYLALAEEYRIPAFLPRLTKEQIVALGLGEYADFFIDLIKKLEESKFPLLDYIIIDTLGVQENKAAFYIELLDSLKPGLTHLLFHPAKKDPELEAMCQDSESRYQDYRAFTDPRLLEHIEADEAKIIGYREIRKWFRENY